MLADRLAWGAAQVLPLHAHIYFYICLRGMRCIRCIKEWVLMSSASKTASKRDERNGTERDGWRRLNVIIRGYMGLTERSGTGRRCFVNSRPWVQISPPAPRFLMLNTNLHYLLIPALTSKPMPVCAALPGQAGMRQL
jgi:hypothetical protein